MKVIKKGYDLPLEGAPIQEISGTHKSKTVAINGSDYVGMKPTMLVKVGDKVKLAQPLFECKKTPGLNYTSPAAGEVIAINRGEKRFFQNIVIKVDEVEEQIKFINFSQTAIDNLSKKAVQDLLVESGLWTAFRTRPYSRVPELDSTPHSIFISLMDTNPLAADPFVVLGENSADFQNGLAALSYLTNGKVHVVGSDKNLIKLPDNSKVRSHQFKGPHPAGNVGTHIHFIDPVSNTKTVWHMGYQDVISCGKLFRTGVLSTDRIISISGSMAKNPRLIKTRIGADIMDFIAEESKAGELRVVSGSAIYGNKLDSEVFKYLGRYHNQVTLLEEGRDREFLGWQSPGFNKFSIKNIYLSKLFPNKKFNLKTNTNGSPRAIVPVGLYEKLMPLDILPTQLLRALVVRDTDQAQALGGLELDEEDLALCTFASPSKTDYGPILRENLTIIAKEG
jgi:Na+-transporting NADH:ubiquinone oxidoreductase subunit A